ncbi:tetratricopeptide (TPR) repeat protein [Kurthia huakuii]|nr:tetratricopeptide (TPR) repeat protein [Kurthia huakuii]
MSQLNHNEQGIKAMQEERFEDAVKAFTQAIEEHPNDTVGYINFGNLLAGMGDMERAERFFQKAISLNEEAATAYYGLANLYYNNERFEEAAKIYERAIRSGIEGADAYYMLGKSFEHAGNLKLALPYMQRAAELAPEDIQVRLANAILMASLEMFDFAKPELEAVLSLDENNADAYYNLGVLYAVSTDDVETAKTHLQKALEIAPEFDQAKYIYDMLMQRKD